MQIRIREGEACGPSIELAWDTVFNGVAGVGDWALAGPTESGNRGGLQATQGLLTAVVLALFTDKRCPPEHPLRKYADEDLRGFWGDGVDVREELGEGELGSLLWLLERAVATEDVAQWARVFALEALEPLKRQGAVARIDVVSQLGVGGKRIDLGIDLFARDGEKIFDRRFEILWQQVR